MTLYEILFLMIPPSGAVGPARDSLVPHRALPSQVGRTNGGDLGFRESALGPSPVNWPQGRKSRVSPSGPVRPPVSHLRH